MKSTMSTKRPLAGVVALLSAVLSLLLSACAISDVTQQVTGVKDPLTDCLNGTLPQSTGDLTIAIAVHQNAPAPAVPPQIVPMIRATLGSGHHVNIVPIDGNPTKTPVTTDSISHASCDAFKTGLDNASSAVSATITTAKAQENGDNLYQAIAVAAETAGKRGHVIVIDSGLADSGPLNFTKTGMTMIDPQAAAKFAATSQPLAAAKGVTFTLLLGYTAPPQQPLSGTERDNVAQIWAQTLKRLGAAKVAITAAPRPDTGPKTPFTTVPSPVAKSDSFKPPTSTPTTTVFAESQIRFEPDSTRLLDPSMATKALRNVIAWLAADAANRAVITGTTSSAGTEAGRLRLSTQRATTIKTLILASDPAITRGQLTVRGVGTHFPGYVDDRRADGSLDPITAAANRTVRITALPKTTT